MNDQIISSSESYTLRDTRMEQVEQPCQDCGRFYLNGEFVMVNVNDERGVVLVWQGCVYCWVAKTDTSEHVTDWGFRTKDGRVHYTESQSLARWFADRGGFDLVKRIRILHRDTVLDWEVVRD